MNKKFKLKIPEMINKNMSGIADALSYYDGKTLIENQTENKYVRYSLEGEQRNWCSEIPIDWLEPIEDGPVSAEEWWINGCESGEIPILKDGDYGCNRKDENIKAYQKGETNDRKRTQPVIDAVGAYRANPSHENWTLIIESLKTLEEND